MKMSQRERRRHSDEFKREAVKLVTEQGLSVAQAARDLDVNENLLRTWKRKFADESEESLSESERMELARLRDADAMLNAGKELSEVLQVLEVSEATYHCWRNQYGGVKSKEARRLKELEEENSQLKKLLAEAELDKAILKEVASGSW
jgi:putative transposase